MDEVLAAVHNSALTNDNKKTGIPIIKNHSAYNWLIIIDLFNIPRV